MPNNRYASLMLPKLIADYLMFCRLDKNLAGSTVELYQYYLSDFVQFLAARDATSSPAAITKDSISAYRLNLSNRSSHTGFLKRSTQNYFLIAVRGLLRFLAGKGIACLPADQVLLGKVRDRAIKFLTPDYIEALLAQPDSVTIQGKRDRAILELLFSTGLRVSEAVSLNRDHVHLERREFGVLGKGGKARVVFLSTQASALLSEYLNARTDSFKPLFIRHKGAIHDAHEGEKMRLTTRSVERLVTAYGKKARLPFPITPHVLRHTFATDLLMNGADLRSVQELLGHANVSTTQIYTHVTNPHLREVHEAFHGRFRKIS